MEDTLPLHYVNCNRVQYRYGVKYMKEKYWKIHKVRVLKRLEFKGCHTKRVYRSEAKSLLRHILFFNVGFRVLVGFYHVFCRLFPAASESGQGIG